MLSGLTPEQQQLMEYDRTWGLRSTFYLGKRILGYDFDEKPHRGICNFVDRLEENRVGLLLDPRGCFKTSIVSQVYVVRRILNNPNIRILLDSVALPNSVHNLQIVRRFFEGHAKLRELYGEFHGKIYTWNDSEFTVCKRTDPKLRDATVTASGIDKIQIGPHYDLIIADDLHNEDNCRSIEQVQKVKQHIRLVFGLLDPKGGEFIIAGHRWSYADAYSMVMGDTNKPEELEFARNFKGKTFIHAAMQSDGELYFPRLMTREYLKDQRSKWGIANYSAMLMNEPVMAGDGQTFSPRYFKRFKEPLQRKDEKTGQLTPKINWYMTVDPGGAKKGNDNWVFFEGGVDAGFNKYFDRDLKTLANLTAAAEHIYRLWLQRRHLKIGYEVAGQQGLGLVAIKQYLWAKYHVALPFVELVHSTDSKGERIESMGPEYEMGKIYHSAQMGEAFGLEDQLLKYPKGEDDIADAASMIREVARAPRVVEQERQPASLDEMITRHLQEEEKNPNRMRRVHPILGSDY